MSVYQLQAPLTGERVDDLLQQANAQRNSRKVLALVPTSGPVTATVANAGYFKLSCTAALALTFDTTGLTAGYVREWDLEVTNAAAGLTFTNTIRWHDGAPPTLIAGTMIIRFVRVGTDIFARVLFNNV